MTAKDQVSSLYLYISFKSHDVWVKNLIILLFVKLENMRKWNEVTFHNDLIFTILHFWEYPLYCIIGLYWLQKFSLDVHSPASSRTRFSKLYVLSQIFMIQITFFWMIFFLEKVVPENNFPQVHFSICLFFVGGRG